VLGVDVQKASVAVIMAAPASPSCRRRRAHPVELAVADLHDVQNGIDDPFARMQAGTAPSITGLKIVFDQRPFGVRQVTRVSHSLSSKKKYLTLIDIFLSDRF
jgi:hypothetical protein